MSIAGVIIISWIAASVFCLLWLSGATDGDGE